MKKLTSNTGIIMAARNIPINEIVLTGDKNSPRSSFEVSAHRAKL
jgi:hypothetical protein